jgi:hypothetical protein
MTSLFRPGVTVAAAITGAVIVAVVGCSTTHSPAASPTGTSTGTPTGTPTGASTPSSNATTSTSAPTATCTTSAADGSCPPDNAPRWPHTGIIGTTGDVAVDNHVWSPPQGPWSQMLRAVGPNRWSVTANFPTDTSVHSYPNTDQIQDWIDGTNRPAALSTWKTMTSSWSVNMSTRPETVAEAAYDLWFDDWNQEVMIQVAFTGDKLRPRCDVNGDVINTVTFGGTGGVPARRWNLCVFDSEMIWQPATGTNYSSGRVDVMAMLSWLENHGDGKYLPANPTLTAVSFGFEICSTGGRNQTFQVNNFSFVATPAKLSGTGWGIAGWPGSTSCRTTRR